MTMIDVVDAMRRGHPGQVEHRPRLEHAVAAHALPLHHRLPRRQPVQRHQRGQNPISLSLKWIPFLTSFASIDCVPHSFVCF